MKLKTLEFFTELSNFSPERIFGEGPRGEEISEALQDDVLGNGLKPREAAQEGGIKNFGQIVRGFVGGIK